MEGVYVLHFDKPVLYAKDSRYGDSRHYVGCSKDIQHRVSQHRRGEGSNMTKAAVEQGVGIKVAALYPIGLVDVEQTITRIGAKLFCPLCMMEENFVPKKPRSRGNGFRIKYATKCVECNRLIRAGSFMGYGPNGLTCYRDLDKRGTSL